MVNSRTLWYFRVGEFQNKNALQITLVQINVSKLHVPNKSEIVSTLETETTYQSHTYMRNSI